MSEKLRFTIHILLLAGLLYAFTAFNFWSVGRSKYNQVRNNMAYNELASYLELSGEVFRVFKLSRRDLTSGDLELTFSLDEAEIQIQDIVSKIRRYEASEIAFGLRPAENPGDVKRINEIDRQIHLAFEEVRRARRILSEGNVSEAHLLLNDSLKDRIDRIVGELIEEGLADENDELQVALSEIEQVNRSTYTIAVTSAIMALLVSVSAIYFVVFRLRCKLKELENGVTEFAKGNLDHSIDDSGQDEFAYVGAQLNRLARQVKSKQLSLEEAKVDLESKVVERTKELHELNEELARRDRSRVQFFVDIGHELRSPITAIRGESEVTLRGKPDVLEMKQSLQRIHDTSIQVSRFVADVFQLAREEAGINDIAHEACDLKKIVKNTILQSQTMVNAADGQIGFECDRDDAFIFGDDGKIVQLVKILISNSLSHCPPGTQIEVSIKASQDLYTLSVEDNGPGISPEDALLVFDRYYKQPTVGGGDKISSGLGMAIAKSIVRSHKAQIWVDTEFDEGTAVRVSFSSYENN
ncbi:ATP-binding protein [Roseovarius sp. EL26]|uniref:sensor histidine kinase n=1 Tax=Roseovarius sp. EL26 TaxID=2126672 RepID=UPI000EA05AAA|nr:ATP-binding protein [Roseovarius sp. EL26]